MVRTRLPLNLIVVAVAPTTATQDDIATVQRKIYDNPNIPDLCAARLEIGK